MLNRSQRTAIAVASAILSLPAFFAAFAGALLVYTFAVLGGYNGGVLQALLKLLSSWKGGLFMIAVFLIVVYIVLFIYLLVRFARGLPLPLHAQLYCMAVVILAIGERIRLLIVDGSAVVWFGALSLPHVLCLFLLAWASTSSMQSRIHFRQEQELR